MQDIRYGGRLLAQKPLFTIVAVLSLAIGIGASASIFSVFNEQFRPLPTIVKKTDRLARIFTKVSATSEYLNSFLPYEDYLSYKNGNKAFSDILAYNNGNQFSIRYGKAVASTGGYYVSGNFFSVLGVEAECGRMLTPDDDRIGNNAPAAVISHAFWNNFLRLDPAAIGRQIRINRIPFTIVGVAPKEFRKLGSTPARPTDIYVPLSMRPHFENNSGQMLAGQTTVQLIGRLKPDVSLTQAQAALQIQVNQINAFQPDPKNKTLGLIALGLASMGLYGVVSYSAARRTQDIGIRMALGARSALVLRQLAAEGLRLSGIGLVAGIFLAWAVARLAANRILAFETDPWMYLAASLILVSVTLIACYLPARKAIRLDPASALRYE